MPLEDTSFKKIIIGTAASLLVVAVVQVGGLIWWASSLTAGQAAQKEQLGEVKATVAKIDDKITIYANLVLRVSALESQHADHESRIRDIERKKL